MQNPDTVAATQTLRDHFRPHLRGMFSATRSRMALGLLLNLVLGLALWGGRELFSEGAWLTPSLQVASAVVYGIGEAVILVLVAAPPLLHGAWRRVAATGLVLGVIFAVLGLPSALGDNLATRIADTVTGIVWLILRVVWCLAPLTAAVEPVRSRSALSRSRVRLRGYGIAAVWVSVLLETTGLLVAAVLAMALPGSFYWSSTGTLVTIIVVSAVPTTLWMVWLGDLDRRIRQPTDPKVERDDDFEE